MDREFVKALLCAVPFIVGQGVDGWNRAQAPIHSVDTKLIVAPLYLREIPDGTTAFYGPDFSTDGGVVMATTQLP